MTRILALAALLAGGCTLQISAQEKRLDHLQAEIDRAADAQKVDAVLRAHEARLRALEQAAAKPVATPTPSAPPK